MISDANVRREKTRASAHSQMIQRTHLLLRRLLAGVARELRVGLRRVDDRKQLSRFTRLAFNATTVAVTDRNLVQDIELHDPDALHLSRESAHAPHSPLPFVVLREVEESSVALCSAVELAYFRDTEPLLKLVPDLRTEPVAARLVNAVVAIGGRRRSGEKVPTKLTDVLDYSAPSRVEEERENGREEERRSIRVRYVTFRDNADYQRAKQQDAKKWDRREQDKTKTDSYFLQSDQNAFALNFRRTTRVHPPHTIAPLPRPPPALW